MEKIRLFFEISGIAAWLFLTAFCVIAAIGSFRTKEEKEKRKWMIKRMDD